MDSPLDWTAARVAWFPTCRAEVPTCHPTVGEVLEHVRHPSAPVAELIRRIRAETNKAARTRLKGDLPAVCFAADLSTRAQAVPLAGKVRSLSGLCCLDFDDVLEPATVRTCLTSDRFTCAAFISPSGNGLKVLVRLADPSRFLSCWRAAADYFATTYGLLADPARKDVAGLCYVSDDPDAHVATGPVHAFQPMEEQESAKPAAGGESIRAGSRNATLASLAGSMRRRGMAGPAILAALTAENSTRCVPPLPDDEVARIAASVSRYAPAPDAPAPWPEPRPLHRTITPPPLDLVQAVPACLPELAAFIGQTSVALQVPTELVAPLVVSLASLGAARALEVEIQPGWIEPAPVWSCVLADPGERKSAVLAAIARPVHRWQTDERTRLAPDLARYGEERRQVEAQLAALRTALAKPGRKGANEGDPREDMRRTAGELAERLASMPDLRPPDVLTSDATPEAARELLARNGEKLAALSAEADQLDVLLGRYGDGRANLGLFLAGHAGDPCPAHRVGRDLPLERPALVCALAVQPQALEAVLANPDAVGRGLVARFMFVKPATWMGRRELEPPPVTGFACDWWDGALRRLLDLPWPGKVVLGHSGPMRSTVAARVLTLTPEARRVILALRADLEPRLHPEHGDLRHLSAFVSKLPGACARIALAFQALADPAAVEVDEDCMRAACAWAGFLLGHAQAVVGEAADPVATAAIKVWRWILSGQRWRFTAGDCYRDNRSTRIASPDALVPVFDLLEAHGLIRRAMDAADRKGGPRGRWYEVNPAAQVPHPTHETHTTQGAA